jgi:hypothetical protein
MLVSRLVYSTSMSTSQKITVEVPLDLLDRAQRVTGEGITATVRRGLELVARAEAYERLRTMRGKVTLATTWRDLKHDRR